MPKMVPFTATTEHRRQSKYSCLCRQNGVGAPPPLTVNLIACCHWLSHGRDT